MIGADWTTLRRAEPSPIHHYYAALTPAERLAVDSAFDAARSALEAETGAKMAGDDRAERAVEALARLFLESRRG